MTKRQNPWNEFAKLLEGLAADGALSRKTTVDALERFASSFDEEVDRSAYRGELGVSLGKVGAFAEAQRIISGVESHHDRAHCWRRLAQEQFTDGEVQGGLESLRRSADAIEALREEYSWERAEVFSLNAKLLDDFGLKDEALETWKRGLEVAKAGQDRGTDSSDCSAVMTTMAKLLAEAGRLELANSVAKAIAVPGKRALAQELIDKASRKG